MFPGISMLKMSGFPVGIVLSFGNFFEKRFI